LLCFGGGLFSRPTICSNLARYTGMSFGEEADAVDGQELQAAYATHRSQKFGCAAGCPQ